ncbi:MAG: selenium metabolism protein YedF, partial [Firmicutes bacterium]|nr:selenium metabolism protein YedF [Bacillota bacterium]
MTEERGLDCRGLACPQPVIMTKKALDAEKTPINVVVDNSTAKENVSKFAAANGWGYRVEEQEDGLFHIHMIPPISSGIVAKGDEKKRLAPVYLFTQDTLGHGSDELGKILIRSFFTALLEVDPKPKTLLFLNGGVKLTVQGSIVLPSLQKLEQQGVSVLSCGTCLDYYNLKEQLAVGSVTNMFTIIA